MDGEGQVTTDGSDERPFADGPGGRPWRVLVVDDSPSTRALVRRALERDGMEVREAASGGGALAMVEADPPDIVLLDIRLPDLDGREVLARLRQTSGLPVILLTGETAEADRVSGLDAGADDYVVKPFSVNELAARVRATLRRTRPGLLVSTLSFDGLVLDLDAREVRLDGEPVALTAKELDLLAMLASAPGRVFSRAELLARVWGSRDDWQDPATVTEHVHRLRQKIEADPRRPRRLVTARGAGYRFDP